MRYAGVVFLLCLLVLTPGLAQPQHKEVIGYYPSWKWRVQKHPLNPASIPYDKLTIINYAFVYPLPDGSIIGRDREGDMLLLGFPGSDSSLTALAHRHNVRVVLSLGGWEDSGNFPTIAGSANLRAAFAHSCNDAIRSFGFDGIDIDWEFPGYAGHGGTAADKGNFTRLLRVLRDSLDALGRDISHPLILTAALPAGYPNAGNFQMDSVKVLLDQLNIMTYDFYGPWDARVNHNAPLYPGIGGDPARCIDAAFKLYRDSLHVPPSKINLGVPFYGRAYAGCDALNAPHAGADTVVFSSAGAFYYDIQPVIGSFKRYFDPQARVPYLIDLKRHLFVSYDDEESVREKARYVVDQGARGLIIWEITGDYMPDGSTPLLDAIHTTFSRTSPQEH